MGTSVLPYLYRFNGVVDTNNPVLENMETLCSAAGTWLTYDITQGKWAVIINKPGTVVASFDDSNIIGGIQVGTTGLDQLYNAVKVTYPRGDINDQRDFIRDEIPAEDRNPNEPDNDLNISYDILNDPVQAEYLGLLELNQNRLDQTVSFVTDYSKLGIKAGDIVDITSAQYGLTNYKLRVTSVTELDADDGSIQLQIVGVKYDEGIYNPDLTRYERSNQNGLITLNGISQPGNVVATLYEKDSRPRILANTTVPGNVAIEYMELWASPDNVNFEIVGNLPPPGGGTYTTGDTVTFDFDRAATGNVYLKSRALNSSAAGPYSNVAVVAYDPVQVTDAIGNSTGLLDGSGNPLSTLLGLSALLKGLDTWANGNPNINQVVASTTTGYRFVYDDLESGANVVISSTFGSIDGNAVVYGSYVQQNIGTFVPTQNGRHICDYYLNCGENPPTLPTDNFKFGLVTIKSGGYYSGTLGNSSTPLYNTTETIVLTSGTVGYEISSDYGYQNTNMNGRFTANLVAGTTYYVSTFLCVEDPTNVVTKVITVQNALT